jgi:hypothetical protein
MKRMRVRHVCLVAAVAAICAASLLGGCGNDSKILEIKASSSVDNTAHAATINTSEVIYGNALVWIVLTYPDGHIKLVSSGNLSGAGSGASTLDGLPSGSYSYKVYAAPAGPDDQPTFPSGKMVEANVAASGSFTIQ